MSRAPVLALLLLAVSGSALAPVQPVTALAPLEIRADGLADIHGLAVDADGVVHVADREAGTVTRLGPGGAVAVVARHLDRPVGLALDDQGRVLVAEEGGGRVVRLDPDGRTLLARGIGHPRWLAVAEDGTLYVTARRLRADGSDDEPAEPRMILARAPEGGLSVFADGLAGLQGLAAHRGVVYAAASGLRGADRREGVVLRIPVLPDGRAGVPEPVVPEGLVRRPLGLVVDRLGALFVSAPSATADDDRDRHVVLKLHPDGVATGFAARLDAPRGLAVDGRGHLYVVDGRGSRILRFLAPPPPVLVAPPPFTNRDTVAVTGTTVPGARVDVLLDQALPPTLSLPAESGAFAAALALPANAPTAVAVLATAVRGAGLTSAPAGFTLVHDSIAPAAVMHAPAAGAFVHGPVTVRAGAADAGSGLAALEMRAGGRRLDPTLTPAPPAPALEAIATWATTDAADGPHWLVVGAVDRAGNGTTLGRAVIVDNTPPDTEVTAGPTGVVAATAATFEFGGADNLTPAAALQFAWRLDGGPWSPFSTATTATVTGLAPGGHLFEVVARDRAGNEDPTPAARMFSVAGPGALAVAIADPLAGATVAAGPVLVRGTVEPAAPGVAVSVNGLAALVHGGQWAAQVPIAAGDVAITAVARTADGAEATAVVTVHGGDAGPALLLRAEPAAGVAPLAVTWRVVDRSPRPLVRWELDPTGAGGFVETPTSPEGTRSVHPGAGLLFPVLRATDDQGAVLVARTVVHVEDAGSAFSRFQQLWGDFKGRLLAADAAGALAHLAPGLRPRFAPILARLGADLPAVAAALGEVELIDVVDDLAEAAIVQVEAGAPFLYFVYFRRDERGLWLIQEM